MASLWSPRVQVKPPRVLHGSEPWALSGRRRGTHGRRRAENFRDLFYRFFELPLLQPCYETPKNAITKKSSKTTEGGGEKNGEKKATFFVMSRDGLFFRKKIYRVFELPLLRNAQ
jgi:hypothetical protein